MDSSTREGFLENYRCFGSMGFLTLRGLTTNELGERVQYVVRNESLLEKVDLVPRESYVRCTGTFEEVQRAKIPSYQLTGIEVLNPCVETPPVDFSKAHEESRKVYNLKDPSSHNLVLLKSYFYNCVRKFFLERKYVQLMTPKMVSFGSEGGSEVYEVRGRHQPELKYLVQSPQMFKQLAVNCGVRRVFEIGPIFRAQKFKTSRHSNETICLDVESKTTNFKDLLIILRDLIVYVSNQMKDGFPTEVYTQRDFAVISHSKALRLLNLSKNFLQTEDEFELVRRSKKKFLFVVGYPLSQRTFYTHRRYSFDLLTSKAELASGGYRQYSYQKLVSNLQRWGIPKGTMNYYLDSFKMGSVRSMGFGLGLQRLLMVLTNTRNISDLQVFQT